MTIKQALKQKARLVKSINERIVRIEKDNSVIEGAIRSYDPQTELQSLLEETNQLIELKTAIHRANNEVYDKIFRLSELKNLVKTLKKMDTQEGNVSRRGYGESMLLNYNVVISASARDKMVKSYEDEIDALQDELDTYNATKTL
jgi:small nuclear ribonucleoprotein (snRNP)-like protein